MAKPGAWVHHVARVALVVVPSIVYLLRPLEISIAAVLVVVLSSAVPVAPPLSHLGRRVSTKRRVAKGQGRNFSHPGRPRS